MELSNDFRCCICCGNCCCSDVESVLNLCACINGACIDGASFLPFCDLTAECVEVELRLVIDDAVVVVEVNDDGGIVVVLFG